MKKYPVGMRLSFLVIAEAALLFGIWRGMVSQSAAVNQAVSDISDLKDPSPFRAALMGHLGKIHLSLQGYLNNADAALLKQITDSRHDFESSVPEFAHENPRLFPPKASEEIHRTFGQFADAVDRTLTVNGRRMQARTILEQNFSRILFLLQHNVHPLIRKDQPDGDERREAILNIENQLRAWQQNLALAWAQPSEATQSAVFDSESRGDSYMDRYERLELLPRERKFEREIRSLWKTNSDFLRENFAIEKVVGQALSAVETERQQVGVTLNQYLPAMPPAQLEARKRAILSTIRLRTIAACVLGLAGLASLVLTVLGLYRVVRGVSRVQPVNFPLTFQMDLKGTIVTWSRSAEDLYGYSAAEMREQSIGKLFESESEINRLYSELRAAHQTSFETTHKTKTGASLHVRIEFRPVADSSGRASAIGILCTKL